MHFVFLAKVPEDKVCLTLCDDEEMKNLNWDHRQKDKTTDVLSFPVFDSLRSGSEDLTMIYGGLNLGDVVISIPVAMKQAVEFKITYEQEIIHLFVHGVLHLCGFDHELSDDEEVTMTNLEEGLVKKIYKNLKYI